MKGLSKLFPITLFLIVSVASCKKDDCNDLPKERKGIINGKEYVDLGLSVKWATCNVGATNPWDSGDLFAWGELESKTEYSWSTYKYGSDNNQLTKYNSSSSYGTVDNKTRLDPDDDVANVKWGGNWRMPTLAEIVELCDSNNCSWLRTRQNDVLGYLVTSKKATYEDGSIFIPDAGYHAITGTLIYWSSTLNGDNPDCSWCLWFFGGNMRSQGYYSRCYGFAVRPVCP